MKKNLTGVELAKILEIKPEAYQNFYNNKSPHTTILVHKILLSEESVGVPSNIIPISGTYSSGEIWLDTKNNIVYFYVGEVKEDDTFLDIAFVLRSEQNSLIVGELLKGQINKKENNKLFFNERLFSTKKD